MGNKNNSRGSHVSNGKCSRKSKNFTKNKTTITDTTCTMFSISRIINLDKLQSHLSTISRHAATCHYCQTCSGKIVLAGEKYKLDLHLFLLVIAQVAIDNFRFQLPQKSLERIKVTIGKQTWQQDGVKWLLVMATHLCQKQWL